MSKNLLLIAPHPDDEILGAGGTVAKYVANNYDVTILTVAGHRPPLYAEEVYQKTLAEAKLAHSLIGVANSIFLDIPATLLNELETYKFNARIQEVVNYVKPNIVLLPYPDRHVDHRLVFESALVATRPINIGKNIELIAAYETLSETHWNAPHIEPNFTPNWVVDITDQIEIKMKALHCYESQISDFPGPRSLKAVEALAIFRGTQAGFGFGEAFHVIRMTS